MIKGTRILTGKEAKEYSDAISKLRSYALQWGLEEVIFPSIYPSEIFLDKVGEENRRMMWTFQDQGNRDVCLIPEVTAIVQNMWDQSWRFTQGGKSIFYIQRCYRYDRPQAGRYREFTQFGVELLGKQADPAWIVDLAQGIVDLFGIKNAQLETGDRVVRGLTYYLGDQFEISVPTLGAQKQIAGGGGYAQGVGFAFGIERLIMAARENDHETCYP